MNTPLGGGFASNEVTQEMANGSASLRDIEQEQIDCRYWHDFFERAITEVKDSPYSGRRIEGRLQPVFEAALDEMREYIAAIDPRLTPGCFFPGSYKSPESLALIHEVCDSEEKLDELLDLEKDYIASKAARIQAALRPDMRRLVTQEITPGVLDVPEYRPMMRSRSCSRTSFLMVMSSIANEPISELGLGWVINNHFRSDIVEDEEYIKLMQSRTFEQRTGTTVESVSFTGVDLDVIAKLASGIRRGNPARQVYCVLSLLSDTDEYTRRAGIWHSAVLLSADKSWVTVHEPMISYFGSNKRLDKWDFMNRWSQAYMRGHLIIAEPSVSQNAQASKEIVE